MSFALKSGHLFLIDLATPSTVARFQLPLLASNHEKILNIWMNPNGSILLAKTNFAKYFTCPVPSILEGHGKCTPLKQLSKKNCDIISIDWYQESQFICGTAEGILYLVDLSADGSVIKLHSSPNPIDGVAFSPQTGAFLVSSNTIMFWKDVKDPSTTFTKTIPNETEQFEHIDKIGKKFTYNEQTFAWIIKSGIVFGNTDIAGKVLTSATILLTVELPQSKHRIKDFVLTKYHLILLRGSEVIVVNQLNNKIVFQETIWVQEEEKLTGLAVDYSQTPPTIWCFSSANIYEIILQDENSGMWKLLCDQKKFDEALGLKGLHHLERDQIYEEKGNYLFSENRLAEAAECFGVSTCTSTSISALKFLDNKDLDSLQMFLTTKLHCLKGTSENQSQSILLSSWIVWNYMQQLNEIDECINSEQKPQNLENWHKRKSLVNKSLEDFLSSNVDCLDKETIYQIMSNQHRKNEIMFFANVIQDHRFILSYWIRSNNWYESLKVLVTLQDPECTYKYATILLVNSPDSTVSTWMQIRELNPSELIHPILTYFTNFQKQRQLASSMQSLQNYGLNYLKWCIEEHDSCDSIIYSTAIYMMIAGFDGEEKELETINFMEDHQGSFDLDFVLRLSLKFDKFQISIYLYSKLKLYEDAVTLALDKNLVDSAKLVASASELDVNETLRHKLWLQIAKKMLSSGNDVKQTIKSIILDSNEILTMRDLLPLFDEFTTVANLKEELVKSLERHNQEMLQISQEIKNSIKIKKEIVEDIESLKQRYQVLEPGASCDCCGQVLQTRKFFVFPCGHNFHTDCLIKEILDSTDFTLKSKIETFQKGLSNKKAPVDAKELDKLLSSKCCLCSDIKINTIDEPLIENEAEAAAWAI